MNITLCEVSSLYKDDDGDDDDDDYDDDDDDDYYYYYFFSHAILKVCYVPSCNIQPPALPNCSLLVTASLLLFISTLQ